MALVACPECAREVSDKAQNCPGCGVSISDAKETAAAGARLHTVQETSKRLKLHQLLSIAALVIGAVWMFAGMGDEASEPSGGAALLATAGLIWYIVTRFRIWWHHK